jgi:hypothetical protein
VAIVQLVEEVDVVAGDGSLAAAKEVASLSTDREEREVSLLCILAKKILCCSNQVRIEGPAKTSVGGYDYNKGSLFRTDLEKWVCDILHAPGKIREDIAKLIRVRTRAHHAFLSASQLRGRNGLHGFGKLLCILDGTDAPSNV